MNLEFLAAQSYTQQLSFLEACFAQALAELPKTKKNMKTAMSVTNRRYHGYFFGTAPFFFISIQNNNDNH